MTALPPVRGRLRAGVPLAPRTWLRVGGPAEVVFQPADAADLRAFLRAKPADVPVTPIGVASNLLVRDGGIEGVVLRFGGPLAEIDVDDERLWVGAGATDRMVAIQAMKAGLAGLEFLIGIPGTLGGAVRMNAGAFGGETADVVEQVVALDPDGGRHRAGARRARLCLPAFGAARGLDRGRRGAARGARRAVGDRGAHAGDQGRARGAASRCTSRPAAAPSRTRGKDPAGAKAWQLIDAAGCRGLRHGRAMVSDKHCNFLINTGGARAAELEELGEQVRARVRRAERRPPRVGDPPARPSGRGRLERRLGGGRMSRIGTSRC